MAIISHNTVSRYQEAKLNLQSLFKQTYQVAFGLAMVLLITAGRPSPFGLTITVVLGIAFVSWSETKRLSSNRRNESIKRILKKMEEHGKKQNMEACSDEIFEEFTKLKQGRYQRDPRTKYETNPLFEKKLIEKLELESKLAKHMNEYIELQNSLTDIELQNSLKDKYQSLIEEKSLLIDIEFELCELNVEKLIEFELCKLTVENLRDQNDKLSQSLLGT
jgi:hypothetical protein